MSINVEDGQCYCDQCCPEGHCGCDECNEPCDCGSACPACGDTPSYCQGHGEIGDPVGAAILAAHDEDDHSRCVTKCV